MNIIVFNNSIMSLLNWIDDSLINQEYMYLFNTHASAKPYIRSFYQICDDAYRIVEQFIARDEKQKERLIPIEFPKERMGELSRHTECLEFMKNNNIKINWVLISENPGAIEMLKMNQNIIKWRYFSSNTAAIELLQKNPDKIDWRELSKNPAAIELLRMNQYRINLESLSSNPAGFDLMMEICPHVHWGFICKSPGAMDLILKNRDKIKWDYLCENPAAIQLLRENPDKIKWKYVNYNPAGYELLRDHPEKINDKLWTHMSGINIMKVIDERNAYLLNIDPSSIDYLRENPNQIVWKWFSTNPAIFK